MDKQETLELAYQFFFEDYALPHKSGIRVDAFIHGCLTLLPAEQVQHIQSTILSRSAQLSETKEGQTILKNFFNDMAKQAFEAEQEHLFEAWDESVISELYSDQIAEFNGDSPDERPTILFVASIPYFLILREARYLKEQGYRVYLLSLATLKGSMRPVFEETFDAVFYADHSKRLMKKLMLLLRPDFCHVQCWMMTYFFGRMVLETMAGKTTKVVSEFYDITSLYAEREAMLVKWDERVLDLDLACERFILENSDAIVSRFPQPVAEAWLEENYVEVEHLEFQAYPCTEFFDWQSDKPSTEDGIIRLVYAGALIPPQGHPKPLFPEWGMARAFKWILEQDIAIDVYSPPQILMEKTGDLFIDFRRLAERFPDRFRLMDGLPPGRLSQVLKSYDYGILLFNWEPGTDRLRDLQKRGVMATKLFTYLEAGLPILVNAEYTGMSGFVEREGLGLGIHSDQLKSLRSRLEAQDYQALQEGVLNYREHHSMEKEITRLAGLYNRLAKI